MEEKNIINNEEIKVEEKPCYTSEFYLNKELYYDSSMFVFRRPKFIFLIFCLYIFILR